MKNRVAGLLLLLFLFAMAPAAEEDYFLKLDKLLIESSNKIQMKYGELSENIKIIPASFIQQYNIKTLSDLIPYISSMYLSRYRSGEALVFTQGILNSHNERFLLLIDGIPVYDPYYNKSVIDEYYPLDNIDHIEFAPGPYSSLYGTGTFAGYINIVQKKNFCNSMKINAASTERFRSTFSFSGATANVDYWVSFSDLSDKGIGVEETYKEQPNVLGEDPKENKVFRVGFSTTHFQLSLISINYRFKELNQDLYNWSYAMQDNIGWHIFKDLLITASGDIRLGDRITADLDVSHQKFSRDSLWGYTVWDSTGLTPEEYYLNNAEKQTDRSFGDLKLHSAGNYVDTLIGIYAEHNNIIDVKDYEYVNNSSETVETCTYYVDPTSFNNFAAYVQMMLKNIKSVNLAGSLRYDYNHFFKNFISPKLSFSYTLPPITIYLNMGRAFRSPSPRELLTITDKWPEANTDLTPEIVSSTTLSLRFKNERSLIEAQGFYMDIKDLIEPAVDGYDNLGKVFSRGISLLGEYQSALFDTSLSMTYTHAEVEGLFQYGYPLFKLSHLLRVKISEEITFSMANVYVGRRPRHQWNVDKDDGDPYLVTDLNIIFKHGPLRFSIYTKNAFDVPYYTMYYVDKVSRPDYSADLKMPGTVVGAELKYEF